MRVRKLIVETLLKEAVEEDQIAAAALEDVFDQLEKDIKANKDKLIPQQQNEAVGVALMGGALAAPVMIKLVGKAVRSLQNLLAKRKGEESVDTNAIIGMGKKLHDLYIKGLEKSLFFIKDEKKRIVRELKSDGGKVMGRGQGRVMRKRSTTNVSMRGR